MQDCQFATDEHMTTNHGNITCIWGKCKIGDFAFTPNASYVSMICY